MTPPKISEASKKQKMGGNTSSQPRPFNSSRFKGVEQAERFKEHEKRKIWVEKLFNINQQGTYRALVNIFETNKWDELISPPEHINFDLVREFYANAFPNDGEAFTWTIYVQGRGFRFDRDAINAILGNPLNLEPGEIDEYHLQPSRPKNIEAMSSSLYLERSSVQYNTSDVVVRFLREDMRPKAQIILLLTFHNIKPRMHISSAPLDTAHLVHTILRGRQVDVARIIANEFKLVAESGRQPGAKANFPLVFSASIRAICAHGRVNIPLQVHDTLSGTIDDLFVARHYVPNKKKVATEASSSGNMDFRNWNPI